MSSATAAKKSGPLKASLSDHFLARDEKGDPHFDLQFSVDGLGTALTAINPALGKLDPTAINAALDLLKNADYAAIGRAVEDAADEAARMLDHLPNADDILSGLETALERLLTAADADLARLLSELESVATWLARRLREEAAIVRNLDVSLTATQLADLLDLLARIASSPLLTLLPVAFPEPVARLLRIWQALARQSAGAVTFVRSLSALGGIDELSRRARALAELLASVLDEDDDIEAIIARLVAAAADVSLADVLDGLDIDDAAAVAAATKRIAAFADDIVALGAILRALLDGATSTLTRADLPALVTAIDGLRIELVGAGVHGVGELAHTIHTLLAPVLALELPDPGAGQNGVAHLSAAIRAAAAKVAALNPQAVAEPFERKLAAMLGAVHDVRVVAERVVAAIEMAIRAFADTAGKIDLRAVSNTLRRALQPVADALTDAAAAIDVVQKQMDAATTQLVGQIDGARVAITDAFGKIRTAFEQLGTVVDEADLDAIVARLREGVQEVATVMRSAPLQPFIDTAVDIMETGADVLAAVPKDLLPASVREQLDAACEAIEKLDFSGVTATLRHELDDIVDDSIAKALKALDGLHDELVAFLHEIDPREIVTGLETAHFDPVVRTLHDLDPSALLAPIAEAISEARAAIASADPNALLAPLETVFDTLEAGFAELEPTKLLAPLNQGADALRAKIETALPIADAIAALGKADAWIGKQLTDVDKKLLPKLDEIYDDLAVAIRSLTAEAGALAGGLRGLLASVTLDLGLDSLGEGLAWVAGRDGAAVVAGRFDALIEAIAASSRRLDPFALDGLVADLSRTHKAIVAKLHAQPELKDSPLGRELDVRLADCDPAAVFAGLSSQRALHREACQAALVTLRRLEGSTWSQITTAAQALRAELAPLTAFSDKLRAVLTWLGADPAHAGLAKAIDSLLPQLRPSVILAPLAHEIGVLVDKLAVIVRTGVLAPVVDALRNVEGLIKLIAVPVAPEVAAELSALHKKFSAELVDLRPTVILQDVVKALVQTRERLVAFDPVADIEQLVAHLKAAIEKLAAEARPTILFEPVFKVYDRVVRTIDDLDVHALLQPVLDAIDDLKDQLEAGMDDAGAALEKLQDACKSPGGLSVGVKVLS